MLEIIEGHLLIKEEAQKEAERKAAAKKGRG